MRTLLVATAALVLAAACAPSQTPAPACPARPLATTSDPLPIVKELSINSRAPVINREAWLIAGFFDTGDHVAFSAIGFDNHVHEHDSVRKDDPAAMARLQQEVTRYLSSGVWRQMILGTKNVDDEGGVHWQMGSFSAMANAEAEIGVRDDDGGGVAGPPSSRYPRMNECEKPFTVEVTNVAVDPKTKWIWATHRPSSPGFCPGVSMAVTFQAWTGVLYPTQLMIGHSAGFSPDGSGPP